MELCYLMPAKALGINQSVCAFFSRIVQCPHPNLTLRAKSHMNFSAYAARNSPVVMTLLRAFVVERASGD